MNAMTVQEVTAYVLPTAIDV